MAERHSELLNDQVHFHVTPTEKTNWNNKVDQLSSPSFTGLTVNGTTLEVDATNNRVGIGTNSPIKKFHLAGTLENDNAQIDTGLIFSLVSPPPTPTVALVSAVGNVNAGTHYYYLSYVTARGETELDNAIGAVVTTDVANGQVDVTVTASSDYRVTNIRIYRTGAGSAYYNDVKQVATITNVNQTYRDNISDASRTGATNSYDRDNTTNAQIYINTAKGMFIGKNNNLFGKGALSAVTTGGSNNCFGTSAGASISTGINNVFMGFIAGISANPLDAIGIGYNVLAANTGVGCVGVGSGAAYRATTGRENIGLGYYAGSSLTEGSYNTFLGSRAAGGGTARALANSVFIGYNAGAYETGNNKLFIDALDRASETGGRTSSLIYGVFDAIPSNQILSLGGGGKVGIGTSSPSYPLHVKATNPKFVIEDANNPSTVGRMAIEVNDKDVYFYAINGAGGKHNGQNIISFDLNTSSLGIPGTGTLDLGTPILQLGNNSWRITGPSSGNFGVAKTASGVYGFQIAGNATTGGIYLFDFENGATLNAPAAAKKPLVIKGATSQTANLQEWQDSTGVIKAYVDKDGILQATGHKSSDGSSGATGSFTTTDGKTVIVKNGLITSIV